MATAKVIIKGENNLGSAVKGAKSDMSSFAQSMQKAGGLLKKAFAATAIIAGLKKLSDACTECFNDFSQANRAYKQLAFTLKDNSAYKSAVQTIDTLSRQTLSSKDQIEAMVAELAALGKSSDEINRISEATVALSNVTGRDLNSSMLTLLNTYNGTTTQLKKLGVDTSNLTKQELESGKAVDVVIEKFGSLSKAMAEGDTSQHIRNIKNAFGDIKQQIGGVVNYSIAPLVADIDKTIQRKFTNIQKVINYSGAVVKNFSEVWKRTMTLVGDMIERVFSWDFISDAVITTCRNFGTLIEGVFDSLEKATGGFFRWSYHYIVSDIYDILAWFPEQLETLLENIVNSVADSPLGRLLNMESVSYDFGSYNLKEKSREHFSMSLQAQKDTDVKGAISTLIDTLKGAAGNNVQFIKDKFGDLFTQYGIDIDAIVAPALEEIEASADATNHSVDAVADKVDEVNETLKSPTFMDKISGKLASLASNLTGAGSSESSSFADSVLSSFTSQMGEAGEVAGKLAKNMATMGPLLGAIATALEYVFEGLNQVIGPVMDEIIEYGLEPLRELGRVIGELFMPILEALMPQLEKIMEFSKILFNAIGTVLQPLFNMIAKIVDALTPVFDILVEVITVIAEVLQAIAPILESILAPIIDSICSMLQGALAPILELITMLLEILTPVIKVFAKIIITVTGTIQYVIQVLQHWVATICNWLAGLSLFGWHPFSGLRMSDPGSPGSYSAYIKSKWQAIDEAFEGASSVTSSSKENEDSASTSTSTSVASASYQGATQVTINIYQQAPVVGDGGMRAFTQMIRSEWENMAYYGLTS